MVCVQWSYDQGLVVVLETTDCPQTNAISTDVVMPLGLEAKKNFGVQVTHKVAHILGWMQWRKSTEIANAQLFQAAIQRG